HLHALRHARGRYRLRIRTERMHERADSLVRDVGLLLVLVLLARLDRSEVAGRLRSLRVRDVLARTREEDGRRGTDDRHHRDHGDVRRTQFVLLHFPTFVSAWIKENTSFGTTAPMSTSPPLPDLVETMRIITLPLPPDSSFDIRSSDFAAASG